MTTGAKPPFSAWNYRTMGPTYAWAAQLTAGYTPKEVAAFAQQALDAALDAPLDATQAVGTKTVNAYARGYDQIGNLIDVLQKNGFEGRKSKRHGGTQENADPPGSAGYAISVGTPRTP